MLPEAKLVAILRDPAERAYSSYLHMRRDGREPCSSFELALKEEDARIAANWEPLWHYTKMGFYYTQLKHYYEKFPRDQIHICLYDDFEERPSEVVERIFRFLGVDAAFQPDMSIRHKVSGTPRSKALHMLLSQPNPAKALAKRVLPVGMRGRIYAGLMRSNIVAHKDELRPETRAALRRLFADDIEQLSTLIGRDLSAWLPIERVNR
jgi:hypothetical protein